MWAATGGDLAVVGEERRSAWAASQWTVFGAGVTDDASSWTADPATRYRRASYKDMHMQVVTTNGATNTPPVPERVLGVLGMAGR